MLGSSYEGFTVVMALLNPHPALKVAAPESPMVDGWMGDDWFHYGAFRQPNLDYFTRADRASGAGPHIPREARRLHELSRTGSAGDFARAQGHDQLPYWQKSMASSLRRLLAGPGARQADRASPVQRPHHVGAGPVGPGRHVGSQPRFAAVSPKTRTTNELPGDGPLVPQPGQPEAVLGPLHLGRRHHRSSATTYCCPSSTSICRRRAQGRHAAGSDLQHRRKPLGPL